MRGFMPYKLAMQRTDALEEYGEWIAASKTVKFRSTEHKRNYEDTPDDEFLMPHGRTVRLIPITIPDDIRSVPYEPKQTWEDVYRGRIDDPDINMWSDSDDAPETAEMETSLL
jgi:hypothetical protein